MFRTFAVETNNDVLFVLHVFQYNDDRYFVSLSMPTDRGHGLQQALEQRPYEEANCLYRRCCIHMARAFSQKDAISVNLLKPAERNGDRRSKYWHMLRSWATMFSILLRNSCKQSPCTQQRNMAGRFKRSRGNVILTCM